ncbi:helix-turn-helix transcriptional regulator [Jiangella aurantiaca]|uniref:helix-turn-helix transcriptional regulator n=1 Tax=Jiangella aurantiaca TaxID=2530373 RepID=UPI0013A5D334|nr:helix-turn-helix transcriptional regulator [Jiangella aurantiaca]
MADDASATRRAELGAFLTSRRGRLRPADVGLPDGPRRRTPGLRREEVAQLAGIGVTWYTWLEQGRDITTTAQTLAGLARALRLTGPERAYLLRLARPADALDVPELDDGARHALTTFVAALAEPAYLMDARWDVVAYNDALTAWIELDYADVPPERRNVIVQTFTLRSWRDRQRDWERVARTCLAAFRASYAVAVGDPRMSEVVALLERSSPEFRAWWPEHDLLDGPAQSLQVHEHPRVGTVTVENTLLHPATAPRLWLGIHTPADPDSAERLARLRTPAARR